MQAVDEELIDSVCERLREHLPGSEAEQAEAFARQYYRWVAPDDLADRSPLDVYGAALAHFDLARRRTPGTPNVRVYNPQFDIDGWQSTHTAVEVVADDMPFLTDSVTAELNRARLRRAPDHPSRHRRAPRRRRAPSPRCSPPRRPRPRTRSPRPSSTPRSIARPTPPSWRRSSGTSSG